MRWSVLDQIIAAATKDNQDLLAARQRFGDLTGGNVHSDHELYGERSDAFVEWYVLERTDAEGLTRVERYLRDGLPEGMDEGDRAVVSALARSYRSLFQVSEIHEGGVKIDDLLGGGRYEVDERRRLPGVMVGDFFEARILPDSEHPYRLVFSRTFLFHPREAKKAVLAHAARARRTGEPRADVLYRLQRLKLRCFAYKHVSAQRIYAQKDTVF